MVFPPPPYDPNGKAVNVLSTQEMVYVVVDLLIHYLSKILFTGRSFIMILL